MLLSIEPLRGSKLKINNGLQCFLSLVLFLSAHQEALSVEERGRHYNSTFCRGSVIYRHLLIFSFDIGLEAFLAAGFFAYCSS